MKFRAIKECPQGQLPGEVFDTTPEVGAVLIKVGAAERAADDAPLEPAKKRRSYNRRDMEAES